MVQLTTRIMMVIISFLGAEGMDAVWRWAAARFERYVEANESVFTMENTDQKLPEVLGRPSDATSAAITPRASCGLLQGI